MKLFTKTWFAVLLCVVAVIASTLLNTRVKFGDKCEALTVSMIAASDTAESRALWQDFMRTYDRFPTRQLAGLAGVAYPELVP